MLFLLLFLLLFLVQTGEIRNNGIGARRRKNRVDDGNAALGVHFLDLGAANGAACALQRERHLVDGKRVGCPRARARKKGRRGAVALVAGDDTPLISWLLGRLTALLVADGVEELYAEAHEQLRDVVERLALLGTDEAVDAEMDVAQSLFERRERVAGRVGRFDGDERLCEHGDELARAGLVVVFQLELALAREDGAAEGSERLEGGGERFFVADFDAAAGKTRDGVRQVSQRSGDEGADEAHEALGISAHAQIAAEAQQHLVLIRDG